MDQYFMDGQKLCVMPLERCVARRCALIYLRVPLLRLVSLASSKTNEASVIFGDLIFCVFAQSRNCQIYDAKRVGEF
jgi:hypothetical protein